MADTRGPGEKLGNKKLQWVGCVSLDFPLPRSCLEDRVSTYITMTTGKPREETGK